MRVPSVFWLVSLATHALLILLLGVWDPTPARVLPETVPERVRLRLVSTGGALRAAGTPPESSPAPVASRPGPSLRELPADMAPPRRLSLRKNATAPLRAAPEERTPPPRPVSPPPQAPKVAAVPPSAPPPRRVEPSPSPKSRKAPSPPKPSAPPEAKAPASKSPAAPLPRSLDRRGTSSPASVAEGGGRSSPPVAGKPPRGPGGTEGEIATVTGRVPLVDASSLRVLRQIPPIYPAASRRRGEEGTVVLLLTVEKGRVRDVEVERSSGFDALDDAAEKALRKWRFDAPGEVRVRVPVAFRLEGE